ncbi:Hypothetical predicted protein [Octopus vulgaris]|uniref:Uncharacterized protein n=1 Tax=Octopus vulgaris TaxID=6645 RepID=A0AA36BA37_OCTVU|nr:Hypothetical predicted protein [Octopus vulgaris]
MMRMMAITTTNTMNRESQSSSASSPKHKRERCVMDIRFARNNSHVLQKLSLAKRRAGNIGHKSVHRSEIESTDTAYSSKLYTLIHPNLFGYRDAQNTERICDNQLQDPVVVVVVAILMYKSSFVISFRQ